jgi:hypothetical protein
MTKFRLILACAASSLCLSLGATSALASADMSYEPYIKALEGGFNNDVLGMLVPSNDTRDNLVFLMADRQKQTLTAPAMAESGDDEESGYVYGDGTVCVSNASGNTLFQAAVVDDASVPADEKKLLQAARETLKCEGDPDPNAAPAAAVMVQSANGKAFADYLAAVDRFYHISHTDAAGFAALAQSSQPWVRETARYMQARIALLQAQANAFDEYGTVERSHVDKLQVQGTRDALNAYVKDYPQGAYVESAKGLLRRADWVEGDTDVLAATYSQLVTAKAVSAETIALANEIDVKLPLESYTSASADPILLAVQDLRLMRPQFDNDDKPLPGVKAAVLEAQRARFAGQEALFDYLLAARAWFADKDAAAVLKLLPDAAPSGPVDYLAFSRQMLRAAALDANGDAKARDLYIALLPSATSLYQRQTLELALAKYDERHKNIATIFDAGTPIQDPDIRMKLLDYVAGPIILKMQATSASATPAERDTALFRLYVRDLTQGRFKGFLDDIKLLPPKPEPNADGEPEDTFAAFRWEGGNEDGYACPDIVAVAGKLAANPKDIQGRLCLGDFLRSQYVVPIDPAEKDDLGGTGTLFAGDVLARHDFYLDIMHDKKAGRDERAYALYRAMHCYQPVGNNDCGGKDVDLAQRKKWFKELKASYGNTVWAKNSDVYW